MLDESERAAIHAKDDLQELSGDEEASEDEEIQNLVSQAGSAMDKKKLLMKMLDK